MADLFRRVVRHDDTTTSAGHVISPGTNNTVMGRQVAKAGDQVWCPACKSHGLIVSVPPMPESFHHGKRLAFDGDLCACRCTPPPRLIASVTNWRASNFKAPGLLDPAAANWLIFAGHQPATAGLNFDRVVQLKDKSGAPLANMPYRITLETGQSFEGVTDASGMTQKIFSDAPHTATIEAPHHGHTDHSTHPTHRPDACGC